MLGLGEIHVFTLAVPADADVERAGLPLLDAVERERAARLYAPAGRALFVASHALKRFVLSRCAEVPAPAWRFALGPRGRPEIADDLAPGLRFSLSHTRGLAVVAVGRGGAVGVDAEPIGRPVRALAVARTRFTPREVEALAALEGASRDRAFLALWTLKEAYAKASGAGMRRSSRHVAVALDPPRVTGFDGPIADDPAAWHLAQLVPTGGHLVGLAVRADAPPTIRHQPVDLATLRTAESA